jgi:gliding motility-associated-like protein
MNGLKSLLFALLISIQAQAQKDTIFWFAAPEVASSLGDSPIKLRFLSYEDAASITIDQPANGGFTPIVINLTANDLDSVNLSAFLASVESPGGNIIGSNGLRIVSTAPISASYELIANGNRETYSLKGNKALGLEFYTPFQKFWANGGTTPSSFSSIEIVATEDNTTVLITPRTAITGHVQNVTFSVLLNEGETYSARDMNASAATSLAGSIVAADKPVAVTLHSGALSQSGCFSTVGDQITSTEYAGTDFVIHKGTGSNDRIYILATQNGTSITINNSTVTTGLISWGETFEYALTDTFNYIETNKPIYLWHVSGYGCELSGAQVPNLFCAGTYSTAFTRSSSDSLGLILYTRSGFENQFTLNGNGALIDPNDFTDVPGTGGEFKVATIYYNTTDIPVGSYNLVENAGDVFGLGVISGDASTASSYAYYSEFVSYPFVTAGPDDTICANTELSINGLSGGGTVTGIWSTSGFGSFDLANTELINEYIPSPLDTLISPIRIILTSTGPCPVQRDTILLTVEPAPIVSASADQIVCVNNAEALMAGQVTGGATTGIWSSVGTGSFSPNDTDLNATYIPSAADLLAGSVQLTLTSTNFGSCVAESDSMILSFSPEPIVDSGADTLYTCENNPNISLSGSVSGGTSTGKWTSSGTGFFTPDNLTLNANYNPSPQDISGGNVWLYLESTSNGDCNPAFDSLIVVFTSEPAVNAGPNQIVCVNDAQIDLAAVISGATTTGTWSGGLGTFSPDNTTLNGTYTPAPSEIVSGTVLLTLTSTNNNGCLAESDVLQINFTAQPFANFNYTEDCLGEPTVLTDFSLPGSGSTANWEWDLGDLSTQNSQNVNHVYSSPGTYTIQLIVTNSFGCSDTTTNTIDVYAPPIAGFTYTSDCPNNQIIVDFTDASSSTDALNYYFYDFGGQGSSATANPSQIFNANAEYSITHIVGTVNGCFDTIVEVLSVPPLPNAAFGFNSSNGLNIGAEFDFFNNSTNSNSYSWEFDNGLSSTLENPSTVYYSNGTYVVSLAVTGALGCTDSTSQVITINTVTTEIEVLIPNAISPNGDGKNDYWDLDFLQLLYPNAHVEIYNEWGQQIFISDGYSVPWNGTYNGELVPDGNYFYILDLTGEGNEDEIFKGAILVLKSRN